MWELPFCLIQGAVVVPYLYIGFLAKKKHLLDEPLPPKVFAGLLAATALIAVGALATRTTDCISLAEWSLGPLSIFLDGAAGLLFIRLFMRLSRGHGPIVHFLEAVGRRSLNIFCVHTVEIIAIPWYLMVAKFSAQPVLGMWLQYAISLALSGWCVSCCVYAAHSSSDFSLHSAERPPCTIPPGTDMFFRLLRCSHHKNKRRIRL